MELADEVRSVIVETLHLDLKPDALKPETPLFGPEGLGLDSLDALELVVQLKRRFKVEIKDRAQGEQAFRSFGALVDYVRQARAS